MAAKSIYAEFAPSFIKLGYSPIARFPENKWPKEWSKYCAEVPSKEVRRKWGLTPEAMISLCCGFGNLVAIDVDTDNPIILNAVRKALPHCLIGRVGSKGWAILCRYEGPGECKFKTIFGLDGQPLVEIKGDGQHITVPPSLHAKTGKPYQWLELSNGEIRAERPALSELPIITESAIDFLRETLKPWTRPDRVLKDKSNKKDTSAEKKNYVSYWQKTYTNVAREVAETKGGRNIMLFQKACRVGLAVHHGFISEREYYDGFTEASRHNGLLADEGLRSVEATLRSALGKSAGDELPELPERERSKPNGKANGHAEHMANGHDKEPPQGPPEPPTPPGDPIQEGPGDERPLIRISGGSLSNNASDAETILYNIKVPLYRQGGWIVRPSQNTLRDNRGDEISVPAISQATAVVIRDFITQHIHFQKWDGRKNDWVNCNPTGEIAETILSRKGEGPKWRTIAGITSTPVMRRDASIAFKDGFDEATGMYLMKPVKLPPMPENPGFEEATDQLKVLSELLIEFPFHDGDYPDLSEMETSSYAVAMSALLTPLARAAISVAPMHIAKAPAAGTGKSYLFNIASAIAHGTRCPVIAAGQDEEETEKRLASRIIAGNSIICIDNVNGTLSGDLLAQSISEDIVAPRVLGRSESPNVTNRFTIFATGNNIAIKGDLNRRCIVCNMDAGIETPSERRFKTDPVGMVLANRGRYVAAVLIILRAHALAGYPGMVDLKAYNSFEDWNRVVRAALVWLGLKDPVESLDSIKAEDPQRMERASFVQALYGLFEDGEANAVPIAKMIAEASNTFTDGLEDQRSMMLDILKNHGDKHGNPNSLRMGHWLRSFKDSIFGDLRLRAITKGRPQAAWYVEKR